MNLEQACGERVSNDNCKNNGLPNFLIDTILKEIPDPVEEKKQTPAASNHDVSTSLCDSETLEPAFVNSKVDTIASVFDKSIASKSSTNLPHEPFDLFRDFLNDQVKEPSNCFGRESNHVHTKGTSAERHFPWQHFFLSTFSGSGSYVSPRLGDYCSFPPLLSSNSYNLAYYSERHFEIREQYKSDIANNVSKFALAPRLLPSGDFSSNKSGEQLQKHLSESENILFQLNELSEKVLLRNQETKNNIITTNQKSHYKTQSSVELKNDSAVPPFTKYSHFVTTPSKDEAQHPAWVFCTRYSDRPCAGPRVRKAKKEGQKVNESNAKRERTAFSELQLSQLQEEFRACPYLTEDRRVRLAEELGLSVAQIKVWFQNKRAKVKKASGIQSRLKMGLIASGIYEHGTITASNI